nr:MAG TPA: tail protein [Caudoviricetes sp.]
MERQLINYLPYVVRDFAEVQGINVAEQPEFERVWDAVDDLLDNQFITTAGNTGLSRWEKILEISPKATDTLDDRRFRILTRINEKRPFTIPQIKEILQTLCGKDDYSINISEYTLTVRIGLTSKNNFSDMETLLQKIAPANIVVDLSLAYNQHQSLQTMTHSQLAEMTHYDIRNEIMKG